MSLCYEPEGGTIASVSEHERANEGSYNDESHGFARPFTTACGRASPKGEALIGCTRINKIRSPRQSFPLQRDSHATAMPTLGKTNYTGAATNKELTLLNQTVHSCHSEASVEKSPAVETKSIGHVMRRDEGVPPYRRLRRKSDTDVISSEVVADVEKSPAVETKSLLLDPSPPPAAEPPPRGLCNNTR